MVMTGKPGWDSSVHKATPPQLKGMKPVTPEPWARDAAVYEAGMDGHGFKAIDTGVDYVRKKKSVAIEDVASKIQNDMIAYRKELGGEKKPPVSARMLRAHGLAAPPPMTPKSNRSARGSARAGNKEDEPPMSAAASERAARIKAKSPPKDPKK